MFDVGSIKELSDVFGDTYGKTAAANDMQNAELQNKQATSTMLRGQGLKSMFDVKRGEAMLPSELAVANANADPELLKAQTAASTGKAKLDVEKYKMAIDNMPAEQLTNLVMGNMKQQAALMSGVISNIQAGADVQSAVNAVLEGIPPKMKAKLLDDPAFLQQLNVWTNATSPQEAVQVLGNGVAGIQEKMQSFDPETWRTILKEQAATDRNDADNRTSRQNAETQAAAQSASSGAKNPNAQQFWVQKAQEIHPTDLKAQAEFVAEKMRESQVAVLGSVEENKVGVKDGTITETKSKTPGAAASSRQPTNSNDDRVVIKKNGKPVGTIPRHQLPEALKQGYTQ